MPEPDLIQQQRQFVHCTENEDKVNTEMLASVFNKIYQRILIQNSCQML